MRFLCRIGFHKWGRQTPAEYRTPMCKRLAIPKVMARRECLCCDAVQLRDEHCLGMNPPEYTYRWITQ